MGVPPGGSLRPPAAGELPPRARPARPGVGCGYGANGAAGVDRSSVTPAGIALPA